MFVLDKILYLNFSKINHFFKRGSLFYFYNIGVTWRCLDDGERSAVKTEKMNVNRTNPS